MGLQPSLKRAQISLSTAQANLSKFRKGPLAAFQSLLEPAATAAPPHHLRRLSFRRASKLFQRARTSGKMLEPETVLPSSSADKVPQPETVLSSGVAGKVPEAETVLPDLLFSFQCRKPGIDICFN